jgi:putative chitinase
MGHESADFTRLTENLNYSAAGLVKTWPKRFTEETAQGYHRKPEKIANKVYADRMGNGNEASGDGWKYRGRGIIQITGKNNYVAFSNAKFDDLRLLEDPDYLLTPEGAVESACWFWTTNNLNEIAGAQNITLITKRINGGTHGLSSRIARYERAIDILKG